MLNNMNAIATIGVKNLKAARDFYEKKLGLEPVKSEMPEEVLFFKSGNTKIELYHSDFAGSNQTTVLTWSVGNDIHKEVKELRSKGINFEHYNFPDMKLDGDVHVMGTIKAAWFKDPDGNILSLTN